MSVQGARVSAPITNASSIICTKPGTNEHYIKVKNNDPFDEWIELPLGKIPSRPKGQHEKDYNVFANVFPLRYLTPEHRSDQAGVLRRGWLYVFLNGKLWRELQVHGQAKMNDVDFANQRGKDVRKATSLGKSSVIVPHKIAGREQTVQMAYSEVQWSWSRVQKLETDAALRGKRMQTVCLAQRSGGYQPFGPQGNKAKVQHVGLAYKELQGAKSPEAHWLKTSKDEANMPVVYLHDPIGVAELYAHGILSEQGRLMREVSRAKMLETLDKTFTNKLSKSDKPAYYRAALLAYRTFFELANPKIRRTGAPRSTIDCHARSERTTPIGDAAAFLDRGYLEKLLAVESRRNIRANIRELKRLLANYLDGKRDERPIRNSSPDFIDVNAALLDYAALNNPNYALLWGRLSSLTPLFNCDPVLIDSSHNRPSAMAEERLKPSGDPGYIYYEKLLQEQHPLHLALFPTQGQSDIRSASMEYKPYQAPPKLDRSDGTGSFRPAAFASIMLAGRRPEIEFKTWDMVAKEGEKIISDFVANFAEHWQEAWKGRTVVKIDPVLRLIKATKLPEFVGMRLVAPGSSLDGHVVMDGKVRVLGRLKQYHGKTAGAKKGDVVDIVDPRTGEILGSQARDHLGRHTGVVRRVTTSDWAGLWGETKQAGGKWKTFKARGTFLTVPETSPYAIKYHNPEIAAAPHVAGATAAVRYMSKTLPPLVAVVEMMNLRGALQALKQTVDAKNLVNFLNGKLALFYAGIDASVKVFGEERALKFCQAWGTRAGKSGQHFLQGTVKIFGKDVRIYSTAGANLTGSFLNGASAVIMTWEAFDTFQKDDHDAGMAYSVSAASFVGAALAGLGGEGGFAALTCLGPYGWVFLGLALLSGVAAAAWTDTDWEQWSKHGPFAKAPKDRMSHDMAGKSYRTALEKLMAIFMQPSLSIRQTSGKQLMVEMRAPGFEVDGASNLQIQVTAERAGIDVRGFQPRPAYSGKEEYQTPFRIEPLWGDNFDQIGVRYYFEGRVGFCRWRARARHTTAEGFVLPPVGGVALLSSHTPTQGINASGPGWVLASFDTK